MGTRYSVGDRVTVKEPVESAMQKPRTMEGEVTDVHEPDSDSPTYIVQGHGSRVSAKASNMKLIENDSPADPWVFDETDITETQLLGTHRYEDVLYTGETDVVDVRTGRTPDRLDRSVQEAKEFAEDLRDSPEDPIYVAKADNSPERSIDSGSPYSGVAFFHFSITGSMDWHKALHAAWQSREYDVDVMPDYESGDLEITVRRA